MKTHPRFLGYHISVQKPVRIRTRCLFAHLFELVSGNSIGKSTANLVQLCLITGLENQVLPRVETYRAWNTHLWPTLNQETDGERDVPVFDAEMIQHSFSSISVHTASLAIVADQHLSFPFHFCDEGCDRSRSVQHFPRWTGSFLYYETGQEGFLV